MTYLRRILPELAQQAGFELHLFLHRDQLELFYPVCDGVHVTLFVSRFLVDPEMGTVLATRHRMGDGRGCRVFTCKLRNYSRATMSFCSAMHVGYNAYQSPQAHGLLDDAVGGDVRVSVAGQA